MSSPLSKKEAKERAGRFCSFRERSPQEVLEKLHSWGIAEADSHDLVAELIEMNFINEQRFANAYCNDKFEFNSWGKQKIKSGIYPHRISEKAILSALDRIDPTKYEARLFDLASKKWNRLEGEEEAKRKQKTVNFLAGKGYELDLIWNIISSLATGKSRT